MESNDKQHDTGIGRINATLGMRRGAPWDAAAGDRTNISAKKLRAASLLHFLLGISLFFPGFSVLNVGKNAGLQVALILGGICGIVRIPMARLRMEMSVVFLLIGWGASLVISVALEGWQVRQIHAMVGFDVCLLLIAFFSLTCDVPKEYDVAVLKGLIAGGVISTIYALYQQAALQFGLPFGIPPLNNATFTLITDGADAGVRSYAFFPEPSMLAAYLIPITAATLLSATHQHGTNAVRRWLLSIFLSIGLLCSGSFSVFLSFPIILFLCLVLERRALGGLIKASIALMFTAMVLLALVATSAQAASLCNDLVDRLAHSFEDASLITRYGLKIASFRVFAEHPIFGAGVSSGS